MRRLTSYEIQEPDPFNNADDDDSAGNYLEFRYTAVNPYAYGQGMVGTLEMFQDPMTLNGVYAELSHRCTSNVVVTLQVNGADVQAVRINARRTESRFINLSTSVTASDYIGFVMTTLPAAASGLTVVGHVFATAALS